MRAAFGDLVDALDLDPLPREIIGGAAGRDDLPAPVGELFHRADDARLVAVLDRYENAARGRQAVARAELRSEERRVGKEWVRSGRSRGVTYDYTKKRKSQR